MRSKPFKLFFAIFSAYFPFAIFAEVTSAIDSEVDWKVVMVVMFEKNPGLMNILLTTVILPLAIILLQSRNAIKQKKLEAESDMEKIRQAKQLDQEIDAKKGKETHEGIVYTALVAILFEVQKLHIRLSAACVDYNCLSDASKSFQAAFEIHQAKISENQLYLSSRLTGLIYTFYEKYGNLLTELTFIQDGNKLKLALPCVHDHSQLLAEVIIQAQEVITAERADLTSQFNRIELEKMKFCCGRVPPPELVDEYKVLKSRIANRTPTDEIPKMV